MVNCSKGMEWTTSSTTFVMIEPEQECTNYSSAAHGRRWCSSSWDWKGSQLRSISLQAVWMTVSTFVQLWGRSSLNRSCFYSIKSRTRRAATRLLITLAGPDWVPNTESVLESRPDACSRLILSLTPCTLHYHSLASTHDRKAIDYRLLHRTSFRKMASPLHTNTMWQKAVDFFTSPTAFLQPNEHISLLSYSLHYSSITLHRFVLFDIQCSSDGPLGHASAGLLEIQTSARPASQSVMCFFAFILEMCTTNSVEACVYLQ